VNAKRTQELFTKKTSSEADVDQAIANLHQAEANVKIKRGRARKAKADLDHCTITSPIDGVVISRSVDGGQTVAGELAGQLFCDRERSDQNANRRECGGSRCSVVKVDQNVDFTVDAFPMQTFQGKVVQVRNARLPSRTS